MRERNSRSPKDNPEPFYITRQIYLDLLQNLKQTAHKVSKEFPTAYKETTGHDLRENSPRDALDLDLGFTNGRLVSLRHNINRAIIVDDLEVDITEASPGTQVTLTSADGINYDYVLLSVTDQKKGYLSINSPLGRVLLGKKAGEDVELVTQDFRMQYMIRKITKPFFPSFETKISEAKDDLDNKEAKKMVVKQELTSLVTTAASNKPNVGLSPNIEQQVIVAKSPIKEVKNDPILTVLAEDRNKVLFESIIEKLAKQKISVKKNRQEVNIHGEYRETQEIIEFFSGSIKMKVIFSVRPKLIRTNYNYTKRRGDAQIHQERSKSEFETSVKAYKLVGNRWVEVTQP